MDDYDGVFCANILLKETPTPAMKRGHLHQYLEKSVITEESGEIALNGPLEKLTYCLGTKKLKERVAGAIDELALNRYTQ